MSIVVLLFLWPENFLELKASPTPFQTMDQCIQAAEMVRDLGGIAYCYELPKPPRP